MNELWLGLFGGAGATVIWEIFLKPLRESRSVAEVLSAEVSINLQLLGAAQVKASADKVPPEFELSTMVFDAVATQIGLLRPQVVNETIVLYRYFKQLNALPGTYARFVDDHRNARLTDSPYTLLIETELTTTVDVFNSYVVSAIQRANITQPLLLKSAFPWWSVRKYRRKRSKMADLGEIAERMAVAEAARAALREKLRRR